MCGTRILLCPDAQQLDVIDPDVYCTRFARLRGGFLHKTVSYALKTAFEASIS